MKTLKAALVLEDGTIFEGSSFGADGERTGEIVFNTSLTGYQEILTDPSYKGQIVVMTYPLIGNYGVNFADVESAKIFTEGFVVKECSSVASNWRSKKSLREYLKENNVIGIEGIDTRALTKHLRMRGAMKAVISTVESNHKKLVEKAIAFPGLLGRDLVKEVIPTRVRHMNRSGKYNVVVVDCGIKLNILRKLAERNCRLIIVPATASAAEILHFKPRGILLSNGPGDPAAVSYLIETVKELLGSVPIFGICLGHQILGWAFGGKTYKLKFGHHGGNHPVKDLKTGKIAITAQNHCFSVEIGEKSKIKNQKSKVKSRKSKIINSGIEKKYFLVGNEDIEITHINLNDGTCEGMRHKKSPVFSVQFHPEAAPGPHDADYLFDEFIRMMKK